MAQSKNREVKVGIFVTALLIAMGVVLYVVGGSSDLLKSYYTLNGAWEDVSGLKEGAVVRLAGWDVGEVSSIRFSDDLGVQEMFVTLKIKEEFQPRIRKDSVARIDTVGVLGDKYVAITMGNPSQPVLDDEDWIATNPPLDVLEYTKKVSEILESTNNIAHKVDLMLGEDSEAAKASLARSFGHLEALLQAAKEGDGLLHALVYDEGMTRKVDSTLTNLQAMSYDLRTTTTEIRTGDGIAHELIYGENGAQLAQNMSELSAALGQIAKDIKSEESLVHALLYEPKNAEIVENLVATSAHLRETSEAISDGEGTIGLLARDPALYEDLRSLLGGAQRNKLLKAYIRRTVEKGEQEQSSPWEPVKPTAAPSEDSPDDGMGTGTK